MPLLLAATSTAATRTTTALAVVAAKLQQLQVQRKHCQNAFLAYARQQHQQQQQQEHIRAPTTAKSKQRTSNLNVCTPPTPLPVGAIFILMLVYSHNYALPTTAATLTNSPAPMPIDLQLFNGSNSLLASTIEFPQETTNLTLKSFSIIDGFVPETSANQQPIFDFGMARNISGRTGQTEALIKCRVDLLNDKSVSWIRKRDLHILTVGTATYTSDKRFEVTESKDAREWTLHVKAPQPRDSGIYECQVNTEPKMSMAFQLNIIEISPDAKAFISGPPDLHFKVGSAIILNCIVQQPSIKDIGPIYWYRGEHIITPFETDNDNDNDNDVDTMPELTNEITSDFAARIAMESQLGDTLKSRLRISNAQTTDTGNYSCQPTTASGASVMVHVINDENPAAMQKSVAVPLYGSSTQTMVVMLVCYLAVYKVVLVVIAAAFGGLGEELSTPVLAVTAGLRVSGCEVVLVVVHFVHIIMLIVVFLMNFFTKPISALFATSIILR